MASRLFRSVPVAVSDMLDGHVALGLECLARLPHRAGSALSLRLCEPGQGECLAEVRKLVEVLHVVGFYLFSVTIRADLSVSEGGLHSMRNGSGRADFSPAFPQCRHPQDSAN